MIGSIWRKCCVMGGTWKQLCDWRCVERVCCVMIGMCRECYVMGGV